MPLDELVGAPRVGDPRSACCRRGRPVEPRTHEGYEWFYDHDITMSPGEAAEFDCHVPHWFGSADDKPVEILSLFGKQGEKMHVRARPARVR